jgi:dihydroflavonol-4-reductase
MKVLVTGATGFLGGWIVRRLINDGHDVRIIKRPKTPLDELEGLKLDIAIGDVTDYASLKSACQGVDTVFHLAGLIAYTPEQRGAMERVNVGGTENVVKACIENNVRRMVHLSSVVAIGASFDGTPLNEDSPYNISHLNLGYFETKHKAELIVKAAVDRGELDAVMINPSTIYGRADAKKGSRSTQLKVARGKFPFYTSGGVSIVAVDDVVDAIIAAWQKGRKGERYIVSGENITIKQLFTLIAKEAGVAPPKYYLPNFIVKAIGALGDFMTKIGRKGPLSSENAWTSILFHWFDSSKARRELGLNPKPAAYAIHQSVSWMKENGYLKDQDRD